jgi:diaminohydroxyphosphoribosylaminopyrimidine deaminase/5-amino-6-(5-phosphoribosylamino)uracil reductase
MGNGSDFIPQGNLYMQRCMELAQRAKGHTAPNPMVGAVLVYNDRVIGEGWHHYYGADHAEVNCLTNVAEPDKHLIPQSTMYVSLEPCAHQGITPPCAVRLVKEQVKKVVIANADPFEKVSGEGIKILQDAGIEVLTGVLEKEGLWLNRRFFCFHSRQRPYIILKWAQTKDGFIAPADRSRLRISGNASQLLLHKWRTEESAIMIGTTTAINDDPQLTARLWPGRQPLRIVLDKDLRVPATHHLFNEDAATWIVNQQKETLHGNIHHIRLTFDDTLLAQLLHRMHEARLLSLVVEGGAHLLDCFIQQGLWDEARVFRGEMSIANGIAAPAMTGAPVMSSALEHDTLQVWVNSNSPYKYIPGMYL